MITNNCHSNQLPKEIKTKFDELENLMHLLEAGIAKAFGFSCSYLSQLVFRLIFTQRIWYRLLDIPKIVDLLRKDTVYLFLSYKFT